MNFTNILLISFSISMLMFIFSMIISKFTNKKLLSSPFECGFNPLVSPRLPFSLHFFLIVILFLIFDIEIILILPFPLINYKFMSISISLITTIFILITGLLYEWLTKFLQWM